MRFEHRVKVRFSDTDALGHVNNAKFLSYLEEARRAFVMELGGEVEFPRGMIVARIEIDYVLPVMADADSVVVTEWVSRIGTKSFGIDCEIHHRDQLVARAKSVIVAFDYVQQRSRELSDGERKALEPYREER